MISRTLHTHKASRVTIPLKKADPCVFCAGMKWPPAVQCTVVTLDRASRATLPLKMPDPCVFCAGMKWPPAQCTSMRGITSVRDVTTTSTKLRYPANLITIMKYVKFKVKATYVISELWTSSRIREHGRKGRTLKNYFIRNKIKIKIFKCRRYQTVWSACTCSLHVHCQSKNKIFE